jgi:hypothetical protein
MSNNKPTHSCFNVRNRGEGRDPYWAFIGSAFTNKDGSLNVTLDSLPMDGKIVIRVRKERDETAPV